MIWTTLLCLLCFAFYNVTADCTTCTTQCQQNCGSNCVNQQNCGSNCVNQQSNCCQNCVNRGTSNCENCVTNNCQNCGTQCSNCQNCVSNNCCQNCANQRCGSQCSNCRNCVQQRSNCQNCAAQGSNTCRTCNNQGCNQRSGCQQNCKNICTNCQTNNNQITSVNNNNVADPSNSETFNVETFNYQQDGGSSSSWSSSWSSRQASSFVDSNQQSALASSGISAITNSQGNENAVSAYQEGSENVVSAGCQQCCSGCVNTGCPNTGCVNSGCVNTGCCNNNCQSNCTRPNPERYVSQDPGNVVIYNHVYSSNATPVVYPQIIFPNFTFPETKINITTSPVVVINNPNVTVIQNCGHSNVVNNGTTNVNVKSECTNTEQQKSSDYVNNNNNNQSDTPVIIERNNCCQINTRRRCRTPDTVPCYRQRVEQYCGPRCRNYGQQPAVIPQEVDEFVPEASFIEQPEVNIEVKNPEQQALAPCTPVAPSYRCPRPCSGHCPRRRRQDCVSRNEWPYVTCQ